MPERPLFIRTNLKPVNDGSNDTHAVAFAADGEHLVSGDGEGVQIWRVKDGTQVAKMAAKYVTCLAVSKDGKWIAAGTLGGDVVVWDAKTYERVFSHKEGGIQNVIHAVDFSPDSIQLVAASRNQTASGWDVATGKRVLGPLNLRDFVTAAKYSPQGDRIAISTEKFVEVFDSNSGRSLMFIPGGAFPLYNTGLFWLDDQLYILSGYNKVLRVNALTRSIVSEWTVPDVHEFSCIAFPQHGEFVAYSTACTLTLWDASTHSQLGLIQYNRGARSMSLSPDNRLLAMTRGPKIAIYDLFGITEPDLEIDDTVFESWKQNQLENAETSLSAVASASQNPDHHVLAGRALIRSRLRHWDNAVDDAEQSITIQPSIIGYIAKSLALVSKGEKDRGYRTCDVALLRFHSAHHGFLLLFKAIIIFMGGEHEDAISRLDNLITMIHFNSPCHAVKAYMYLLLGNMQIEYGEYEDAVQSLERAQSPIQHHSSRVLVMISLISGWKFDHFELNVRRSLCEALYGAGRTKEAVESFTKVLGDVEKGVYPSESTNEWVSDFKRRCCETLERLGDAAVDAKQHDEAVNHYSVALSLNPESPHDFFIKRCKVQLVKESWYDASYDAYEVIEQDPSSPLGYELNHAAFLGAKNYFSAIQEFETMLSKMEQSPDPKIRERRSQYISPSSTRARIRNIVQRTVRHLPRMLICTSFGSLLGKKELVSAFEHSQIGYELLSSMTTRVDRGRIKREVKQFFQYVMLSHKWDDEEPLLQHLGRTRVHDLDKSPTHDKLQTFCKTAQNAGFLWAWSDTCCIDKLDRLVHQEALEAMFRWYRNSAMVIVYLRGVRSSGRLGDLVRCIWNTRAWTLQEYIAAKVIRFYTEDWKLYLDLEMPNHKDSPEITSQMEQVTGVSAERLIALRPGLDNIREKLWLVSTRKTTIVEDAACSLFGIFSVTGLPSFYGEGENALGRLLAHILSSSGDVSILAWTGQSSSINSCLPARIIVYSQHATTHLPVLVKDDEMENRITMLRDSALDVDLAMRLYDRLNELPTAWFAGNRMKLPCIAFKLPSFTLHQSDSGRFYRTETPTFGKIDVETGRDLSRLKVLYLVHPWIDALLGREVRVGAYVHDATELSLDDEDHGDTDDEDEDYFSPPPEPESPSPPTPAEADLQDKETRALQLVSRLKQPFGALLVTLASANGREEYRRVAADSLITVQVQENVLLETLLENVRIMDVL